MRRRPAAGPFRPSGQRLVSRCRSLRGREGVTAFHLLLGQPCHSVGGQGEEAKLLATAEQAEAEAHQEIAPRRRPREGSHAEEHLVPSQGTSIPPTSSRPARRVPRAFGSSSRRRGRGARRACAPRRTRLLPVLPRRSAGGGNAGSAASCAARAALHGRTRRARSTGRRSRSCERSPGPFPSFRPGWEHRVARGAELGARRPRAIRSRA